MINKRHIVLGTAGHIDHGKTALLKHLATGGTVTESMDADRLKEEQERGLTTDIGFVFFGDNITIIDVPGHEKFIKNMVAGVSTVDFVLFVIAADDGIMPQTQEHLEILQLLNVKQGIIIITKIDLVSDDWLELIIEDIKDFVQGTFLEDAPIIPVSNITGQGIDKVKQAILHLAKSTKIETSERLFQLPIDRVFSIKGYGTIVAGTVLSGTVHLNDKLEIFPKRILTKVRNLQIHEQNVKQATVGDRVGINLAGVKKDEIERGNILSVPGNLSSTFLIDGTFHLLNSAKNPMKNHTRVKVHIGTNEIHSKLVFLDKDIVNPGENCYVQIRMEQLVAVDIMTYYVVRDISSGRTIGGGQILDPNPMKHKKRSPEIVALLKSIEKGGIANLITAHLLEQQFQPQSIEDISKQVGSFSTDTIKSIMHKSVQNIITLGNKKYPLYLHQTNFQKFKQMIMEIIKQFHQDNPSKIGISKMEIKSKLWETLSQELLEQATSSLENEHKIKIEGKLISSVDYKITISDKDRELLREIENLIANKGVNTCTVKDIADKFYLSSAHLSSLLNVLKQNEKIVILQNNIIIHTKTLETVKEKLIGFLQEHNDISPSQFKTLLNTSRKYAVPILEYFDSQKITLRKPDGRILHPSRRSSKEKHSW